MVHSHFTVPGYTTFHLDLLAFHDRHHAGRVLAVLAGTATVGMLLQPPKQVKHKEETQEKAKALSVAVAAKAKDNSPAGSSNTIALIGLSIVTTGGLNLIASKFSTQRHLMLRFVGIGGAIITCLAMKSYTHSEEAEQPQLKSAPREEAPAPLGAVVPLVEANATEAEDPFDKGFEANATKVEHVEDQGLVVQGGATEASETEQSLREEATKLFHQFDKADGGADGLLSKGELKKMLNTDGGSGKNLKSLFGIDKNGYKHLYAELDADKSGSFDLEEWVAFYVKNAQCAGGATPYEQWLNRPNDQLAKEEAAQLKAAKEAKEEAAQLKAAKEAKEEAAQLKAAKEAKEEAAQLEAARLSEEKAKKEKAREKAGSSKSLSQSPTVAAPEIKSPSSQASGSPTSPKSPKSFTPNEDPFEKKFAEYLANQGIDEDDEEEEEEEVLDPADSLFEKRWQATEKAADKLKAKADQPQADQPRADQPQAQTEAQAKKPNKKNKKKKK